jgi:hypothetical protein
MTTKARKHNCYHDDKHETIVVGSVAVTNIWSTIAAIFKVAVKRPKEIIKGTTHDAAVTIRNHGKNPGIGNRVPNCGCMLVGGQLAQPAARDNFNMLIPIFLLTWALVRDQRCELSMIMNPPANGV